MSGNYTGEKKYFAKKVTLWILSSTIKLDKETFHFPIDRALEQGAIDIVEQLLEKGMPLLENYQLTQEVMQSQRQLAITLSKKNPQIISSAALAVCVVENDDALFRDFLQRMQQKNIEFKYIKEIHQKPLFNEYVSCCNADPHSGLATAICYKLSAAQAISLYERFQNNYTKFDHRDLINCALVHDNVDFVDWLFKKGVLNSQDLVTEFHHFSYSVSHRVLPYINSPINVRVMIAINRNKSIDNNKEFLRLIPGLKEEDLSLLDDFLAVMKQQKAYREALLQTTVDQRFIKELKKSKDHLVLFVAKLSGNHRLVWSLCFPAYNFPKELATKNPLNFSIPVYESVLPLLKQEISNGVELFAYTIASLFDEMKDVEAYFAAYQKVHPDRKNPLHDACLFNTPEVGQFHKAQWREWFKTFDWGQRYMRLLSFAPTIEQALNAGLPSLGTLQQSNPKLKTEGTLVKHFLMMLKRRVSVYKKDHNTQHTDEEVIALLLPEDYKSFKEDPAFATKDFKLSGEFAQHCIARRQMKKMSYDQVTHLVVRETYHDVSEDHSDFALECVRLGVTRSTFDECLEIQKQHKTKDFIPEVSINGASLGEPDITFSKIPASDPMRLLLGKVTSCCQSIDGHSREAVLHGATSPYGGFYTLTQQNGNHTKWLAQSWVGVTEDWDLLFDSIESPHGVSHELILNYYELAARQILLDNPLINRVLVGTGGNTPKNHHFKSSSKPFSRIIGYKDVGYDSARGRFILADQQSLTLTSSQELHACPREPLKWEVTTAVDTLINPGKTLQSPRMSPAHRSRFFSTHPRVLKQIQDHGASVLAEEGYYARTNSEGYGESFLTPNQLRSLMESELLRRSQSDSRYRVSHCALFDNDLSAARQWLQQLKLTEGDCAQVAYIKEQHVVGASLYKANGVVYVVYFDAEQPNVHSCDFARCVKAQMGDEARYIACNVSLQKDFYSCGVFVIKAFKFFAKHGLEWVTQIVGNDSSWQLVDETQMPARMLKMTQYPLQSATLAHKSADPANKKNTLGDYLTQHRLCVPGGRTYNSAALQERYKLYEKLEQGQSIDLPGTRAI